MLTEEKMYDSALKRDVHFILDSASHKAFFYEPEVSGSKREARRKAAAASREAISQPGFTPGGG